MRRLVLVTCALGLLLAGCAAVVRVDLADLPAEPVPAPTQSHVYAADGSELATLRLVHREPLDPEHLPALLVDAIVSAEDRRFYAHGGVDARAVVRAAVANRRAGAIVQGGSTITQQLAKNRYFPGAEDTLERKAAEAHVARRLEAEMSKDEILATYLDTIYFGAGAYGIVAAAETYFAREPQELTLPQVALLAGLVRSPEGANPHRDPARARAVRSRVLDAMVETGAIGLDEAVIARASPLGVQELPPPPTTRFPYFVELVKRELRGASFLGSDESERVGRLHGGGLRIHTTLDPVVQDAAEQAAADFSLDADAPEVALAAVRPADGHVLALVGGRDFRRRQFDLATQGRRQPASTFKTFAYVAALEAGWRPDDQLPSGSTSLTLEGSSVWRVRSQTAGPLTLRQALAESSNGAFARLGVALGGEAIADAAAALGVTSEVGTHPAVALGGLSTGVSPLELASAYGTLAAGGIHAPPVAVTRVEDGDGTLLWEAPDARQVAVDGEVAWLTTQALSDVITMGTGSLADLGRPAAGKTGTSQQYRDAWFVGATPDLSAAVWIGHPDHVETARDPVTGLYIEGGGWPARIWRQTMTAALADVAPRGFPYPAHLEVTVEVNPESGGIATEWCPLTVRQTGLPRELPNFVCPLHGPPEPETTTPRVPSHPETPTPDPDEQREDAVPAPEGATEEATEPARPGNGEQSPEPLP